MIGPRTERHFVSLLVLGKERAHKTTDLLRVLFLAQRLGYLRDRKIVERVLVYNVG